jgi:hypothetical protein
MTRTQRTASIFVAKARCLHGDLGEVLLVVRDALGHRATLIKPKRDLFVIITQKAAAMPIFSQGVQQSDYSAQWELQKSVA